jgi:hypothetical protein
MDVSYLSELGGKSRATGHFYLTNRNDEDFNNGTILTLSTIIKHVMLSASKAKLATLYNGCKLWYTWTHPTFPNQVVKIERQEISTYPIAMMKTSTMVPYSPY